jgi:hypothetical protein
VDSEASSDMAPGSDWHVDKAYRFVDA